MRKTYFVFTLLLILFLTGCNTCTSYDLFYDQSTMLTNYENVVISHIHFNELSEEAYMDLPVFRLEGENNSFLLNYPMTLAKNIDTGEIYTIDNDMQESLLLHKELLDQMLFGEPLDWNEVNSLFPLYSKAIIRDLETQIHYRVQRRGGNLHADVQPLTKQDTEMMYMAYNNQWSWDRRAVVLQVDGRQVAASINGMPHGAGAIQDNNFNGHSCIHFSNSRVHGSNNIDFAHQLMILKASGQLFAELMSMEPEEILKSFIVFSTQEQNHLNKFILKDPYTDTSFFQSIQSLQMPSITTVVDEPNYKKLSVETLYYIDNQQYNEQLEFEFFKMPHHLTWKIKIE